MTITNKVFTLASFFVAISNGVHSQYTWELKSKEDSISVYVSEVANSNFKAFRASVILEASGLHEIVAILIDVENFDKLFPDIRESRLLKKNGDKHIIHYLINNAPWPVDDREGIFELKGFYYPEFVKINFDCINYDYPVTKGVVRMTKGTGYWKISEIQKNLFEVIYQYHGEPSGKIPAWLANTVVVDHPINTLNNMKKIIASGKYKNARVDFIK
ncbi:MAG: hypothetical protein M3Q95_11255 [Bacteroidota bacterium]|nr:hypothetical protein [Bacteroidota bacterium]